MDTRQVFLPEKIYQIVLIILSNVLFISLCSLSPFQQVALAASKVNGVLTSIQGSNERMISYRQQRHMWMTNDGAVHVLVNLGDTTGLVLYSNVDQSNNWQSMLSIADTNEQSTSDGFLLNRTMYFTYSSSSGAIFFKKMDYDTTQKKWSEYPSRLIFVSKVGTVASNPTITSDDNSRFWCACVAVNKARQSFIRLFYSIDQGDTWTDAGINLGAVSKSPKKSAVLVNLHDRIGAIYTNKDEVYWAYRLNDWSLTAPWQSERIFVHAPSQSTDIEDPYGSHFSVAVDRLQNVHVTTKESGCLLYLRFNYNLQGWDTPRFLSNNVNVGYMQVSTSDNALFIVYNKWTSIEVIRSEDEGMTFVDGWRLLHTSTDISMFTTTDFSHPRVETPSLANNKLFVLQQFVADGWQRLLYFVVPLTY